MGIQEQQRPVQLGFLCAIGQPEVGFVGGLLITNQHGRPLEFQCTTPVKPNRTQLILYGDTLKSWLLGEVIGRTLVERAQVSPDLILTSRTEMLELRRHIDTPVAYCDPGGDVPSTCQRHGQEPVARLGRQLLRFHRDHGDDCQIVARHRRHVPSNADLSEPFQRVQEALNETLKTTKS